MKVTAKEKQGGRERKAQHKCQSPQEVRSALMRAETPGEKSELK